MRKWEISEGGINEFGMRNERIRNLDWGMRVNSEWGMREKAEGGKKRKRVTCCEFRGLGYLWWLRIIEAELVIRL